MRKKGIIALLAIVAVAGLAVAVHKSVVAGADNGPHWKLDGTWIGMSSDGMLFTITFVPASPDNNRLSFAVDLVNSQSVLPGPSYPQMTIRGDTVRTGPRTFEHTWIYYGRDDNREVKYILFANSTLVLTDPNTGEESLTVSIYMPEQLGEDGLPEGEPIGSFDMENTARRLVPVSY